MKRIIYFLSHPIQYQSPLMQQLEKEDDIDLTVCYFTDHTIGGIDKQFGKKIKWDIPLLEGYDYIFLKNYAIKPAVSGAFFGLMNWGIFLYLAKTRPEFIIVHGWIYFSNILALLSAKVLGIKVIIRTESPWKQERYSLTKKMLLNFFVDKALYIGKQNKEFYKQYGLLEDQLFFAPYCVDNDRFDLEYNSILVKRSDIREKMGYTNQDVIILFSGKYINKKRPNDLLRAVKSIPDNNVKLVMVGDGELTEELKRFSDDHDLNERICLSGFINQTEISNYYGIADIFVLPSGRGETWGLVLNEAMNFHLPLIVSDIVGSTDDLVVEGENGYTYPCGNIILLTKKLNNLIGNRTLRIKMGDRSAMVVQEYSYTNIIQGIKSAIH